MKRLPKENEYQLDIKDQFKNEFEIGQLQGNNFHMTDSADLPMLIEPQGNIEQEVIEAVEGIVVEGSSINVNDVDTSYEDSIMPQGNIEQVVVEEIPGNTIEGEIINITNGDSTKEVKAIVNGNSYQETIAEEVGTTVVNKSIHLTDVNTAKESKLTPNGGIEQEQSEANRNKCPDTIEYWESGDYALSGGYKVDYDSRIRLKELLRLENLVDYYVNINHANFISVIRTFKKDKTFSRSLGAINSTTTIQLNEDEAYIGLGIAHSTLSDDYTFETFKTMFENGELKPFIHLASETDKSYVPFSPNMPSLDFPSEVKGVGSEEEINLARLEKEGYYRQYGTGNFAVNESYNSQIASVEPNKTYTIKRIAGDHSNIAFFSKDMTYLSGLAQATTITTPDNCYFVTVAVSKNATSFMIYEGTEDLPYTPYGYCRYETVVGNKNIFNKNGKFTNGYLIMGEVKTAAGWKVTDFIPIPDNAEILTILNGWGKSETHCFYDENKEFVGYYIAPTNVTNAKIPLKDNYKYLRATISVDTYDNFMLAFEDTDTFVEHQEQLLPIDIPIGQTWYSGKPYKINGKWYRDEKYTKYTFKGVEVGKKSGMASNNSYIFSTGVEGVETSSEFINFLKSLKYSNDSTGGTVIDNIYSNYFKPVQPGILVGKSTVGIALMLLPQGTYELRIGVGLDSELTTIKSFNAWAVENKLTIVGELANPERIEITDETLISQLEALQNAELYEGVTNINTYSSSEDVADLPIEAHYNFITPSPSVERPSDIEVIAGVNQIDVVNGKLNGTISGVSCSVDKENQTITVNGKRNDGGTNNAIQLIRDIPVTNFTSGDTYRITLYGISGSYTGRFGITLYSKNTILTYIETWGTQTTVTKVLEFSEKVTSARLFVNGDFNADNYTFKIMVSKGTKEKPYLPYGHIGLLQYGENLYDINDIDAVSWATKENDVITSTGTNHTSTGAINLIRVRSSSLFKVKKGKWYYVSLDAKIVSGTLERIARVQFMNSSYATVANTQEYTTMPNLTKEYQRYVFKVRVDNDGSVILYIQGYNGTNAVVSVTNIQISEENIDYKPYKENLIPIDLQGNTLAKVGDIKDLLNIGLDGSVSIEKKTVDDFLDGVNRLFIAKSGTTKNTLFMTNAFNQKIKAPATNDDKILSYSNCFNGDYSTNYLYQYDVKGLALRHDKVLSIGFGLDSEIDTVEKANALLKERYDEGNIIKVLLQLEKSETINLPNISPIKLFEGTNNFELVTNLDTTINMTYNHVGYSPSIVKPSEVKGVGSEEDINLVDLSKPSGISSYTSYSFEDDTLTIKSTGAKYQNVNYNITNIYKNNTGKILKFQKEKVSQTNTTSFFAQLVIKDVNGTDTYVSLGSNAATHTIPTDVSNISNVALHVYASTTETVENTVSLTKPMLYFYKGVDKPYTPYGYCKYDTLVENKNLYDYKNAAVVTQEVTVDNEGWITMSFDNTNGTSTKFLNYFSKRMKSIKNSKNYNIVTEIKSVNGTGSFVVSSYDNGVGQFPWTGWDLPNLKNNTVLVNERTPIPNQDQSQVGLRSYLHIRAGQSGSITFRASVLEDLTVTAENFEYTPHQEQNYSIDIPAGQVWYSGKPYKVNGKWYRDEEYLKVILDGTETITVQLKGTENWFYLIAFTKNTDKFPNGVANAVENSIYSNMYKKVTVATMSTDKGISVLTTEIRIREEVEDTIDNFKARLKELYDNGTPLYIVYKLAEPNTVQITDATLISQLEALQNAEFYNGVTNINSYKSSEDVANMPLEAHYNFITPSPSIDIPSEVLEVGSDEDINKIGNAILRSTGKGVTLTNNEDGSFTLNGTSTDSIYIDFETNIKEAGDYKVAFNKNQLISSFGGDVRLVFKKDDTSINDTTLIGKQNYNLTFAENNLPNRSYIWLNKGNVFDNFTFYPSVTKGTEIKPYTPYGYCRYETIVGNKNFLKLKEDSVINGVNFTNLENGYFKLEGTPTKGSITISDYFKVKGKINASLEILEGRAESVWFWNRTDSQTIMTLGGTNLSRNIEYDSTKEIGCSVSCTIGTPLYFVARVQVEQGDTKTNQVAHREQLFPIDLPIGMKMYNDEFFYKENGKWYRKIEWKKVICNGTETVVYYDAPDATNANSNKTVYFSVSVTDKGENPSNLKGNIYSNMFKNKLSASEMWTSNVYPSARDVEAIALSDVPRIRINKTRLIDWNNSLTATEKKVLLKNYLKALYEAGTPLEVVYKLAEPYPEEITDANLIAQLEKTLTPFSYYPVTNINSYRPTTNVADFKLYVEYFKSNKITNK